jgi:hypothetical protein
MASFSKQATIFMVAALLLLCLLCPRVQAARPGPGSRHHKSQVRLALQSIPLRAAVNLNCPQSHNVRFVVYLQGAEPAIAHLEKSAAAGTGMEMAQEDQEATRECEGGEGTEECLMRRTLVAHTDYIYTQGKHN